jgi:hypothetical protein
MYQWPCPDKGLVPGSYEINQMTKVFILMLVRFSLFSMDQALVIMGGSRKNKTLQFPVSSFASYSSTMKLKTPLNRRLNGIFQK